MDGELNAAARRVPGLCGLILAAGESSRMGTQKPLLAWPPGNADGTLLGAVIASLQPFCEAVMVVAGKNAALLASVIEASGAEMVVNPQPEMGQFSSMRVGLRAVRERGFEAVMMCPVDGPPLREEALVLLVLRFRERDAAELWGVAPRCGEQRGHPLLAGPNLIAAFLASPAESNAKVVKRTYEEQIEYVEVGDEFVGVNANTPEEFAAVCVRWVAARS